MNIIIPGLHCPNCSQPVVLSAETVSCTNNHTFRLDEDVLVFAPDIFPKKEFIWGKELRDPKENLKLDESQSVNKDDVGKSRNNKMVDFIIDNISTDAKYLLDLATGRGLLMRKLLPVVKNRTIVLSDISTDVLVGTYKLVKSLIGSNLVIPIQSSATLLPFADNTFDAVISYGPNNIRPPDEAFRQVYRVLKKGGAFVFSMALVEQNSPSSAYMCDVMKDYSDYDVIDAWRSEVEKCGFTIEKCSMLFDGRVNKVPLDILPREDGERFQDVGVVLKKF